MSKKEPLVILTLLVLVLISTYFLILRQPADITYEQETGKPDQTADQTKFIVGIAPELSFILFVTVGLAFLALIVGLILRKKRKT